MKKHTIEQMKLLAKQRNGDCIANVYVDARHRLEWRCESGHIWSAIPDSIMRGSWCPQCCSFVSERICREYFETIFQEKFPKRKPNFLKIGPRNRLELDGYCEKLQIAFEHQGIQHYRKDRQFSKCEEEFDKMLIRDTTKRELCHKNGIILIEIPALNSYTKIQDLENLIFEELSKHNIYPNTVRPILLDWKNIYISDDIQRFEKMKEIAILNGGKLLSEQYMGTNARYLWECKLGHKWETVGRAITQNKTWCFHCRSANSGKTQCVQILHVESNTVYASLSDAARQLGLYASNVCKVLKGERSHTKGHSFKYV